jgi:hypothetical protein
MAIACTPVAAVAAAAEGQWCSTPTHDHDSTVAPPAAPLLLLLLLLDLLLLRSAGT